MLAMLRARRDQARSKEFVFPGLPKDEKGTMAPIGRLSKRFLDKNKGADEQTITWSPHDLRRTALTILEAMDVSAYALKRIAAPSQQSAVTAGYLSDDVHRLRAPMERLASVALNGTGQSNIVPMRRKRSEERRVGKSGSVCVDLGGWRHIKKKKT